jgi:hypothetical protein
MDTSLQAILRGFIRNLKGCNVGISDGESVKFAVEMGSGGMIYILSSMTFGSGI